MEPATYQRLVSAFVDQDGSAGKRLQELITTSHWRSLLGNEAALQCKLARSSYVADQLQVEGKTVLDFGSGMGFLSGFMATRAEQVVGVELLDEHRAISRHLADEVFGVGERARFVASIDELEDESVDVIMLNNVVSHVDRPVAFLVGLLKKLKVHGQLFIEDNNNFGSAWIRRRNRKLWVRRDGEYRAKRVAHVRHAHPGVDAERVADRTYGMSYDEIDEAAAQNGGGAPFDPQLLRDRAPLDPDTGILHENAFTPHELVTIMFNLGMVVTRVSPKYLFDYKKAPVATALFKALPRLALRLSPAFELTAVKRR